MPELRGEGQAASLCKDDRRQQHYRAIEGPDGTGISDTGSRGRANHTTEAEARGGLPLEVFKEFTQARARAPRGPRTVHDLPRAPQGPEKTRTENSPERPNQPFLADRPSRRKNFRGTAWEPANGSGREGKEEGEEG